MTAKYATLADVARIVRDTRWLIRGWLPRGYVTVLFGHPEAGKTSLAIQMLRQLQLGEPWPDGEACERIEHAVWVDTEAAHGNLSEKAAAWGIDIDRVFMSAPPDDPLREFRLDCDDDLERLRKTVKDNRAELVVIDSLGNAHQQKEDEKLGKIFHALQVLARDTDAAIVLLHHPRKPDPKDKLPVLTLNDLRGTSALGASARLVWAVYKGEHKDWNECSIVSVLKSNLDEKPASASFRVSDLGFQWLEKPEPTPADLSALDAACDFLNRMLKDGPAWSDDVQAARDREGITERNLKAARRRLGVKAKHEPKARGRWFMTLPGHVNTCTPLTPFEKSAKFKEVKEDQKVVNERIAS